MRRKLPLIYNVRQTNLFTSFSYLCCTLAAFVNYYYSYVFTSFQFHGSEGKSAALASKVPTRGNEALSPFDAADTRLCWRADGQHFAVSFIQGKPNPAGGDAPQGLRRVIRVFARYVIGFGLSAVL